MVYDKFAVVPSGTIVTETERAVRSVERNGANQIRLRDYQQRLVDRIRKDLRTFRAIMLPAPVASGKSWVALALAKDRARVVFLTSRRTLIEQFLAQAEDTGIPSIAATNWKTRHWPKGKRLVIGTAASLFNRLERLRTKGDLPTLFVSDEAHHCAMRDCKRGAINRGAMLVRHMTDLGVSVLGMTATPCRLEPDYGFDQVFDSLMEGPSYSSLIEAGWLARIHVVECDGDDLLVTGGTRNGEFVEKDIMELNDDHKLYGNTIKTLAEHDFTRAVVFCVTQEHALETARRLQKQGLGVGLDVSDTSRLDTAAAEDIVVGDAAVQGLRNGTISVLCGVAKFVEGWDCPEADAIIMLRATKSFGLWRQMCGRVSRPGEGKNPVVYDFVGNQQRHGQPDDDHVWSLLSADRQSAERMRLAEIAKAQDKAVADATAAVRQKALFSQAARDKHWVAQNERSTQALRESEAALRERVRDLEAEVRALNAKASDGNTRGAWDNVLSVSDVRSCPPAAAPQRDDHRDLFIMYAKWGHSKNGAKMVLVRFAVEGMDPVIATFLFGHDNDWVARKAVADWAMLKRAINQPFDGDQPSTLEVAACTGEWVRAALKNTGDASFPIRVEDYRPSTSMRSHTPSVGG